MTAAPPSVADHPAKIWPSRVGVVGSEIKPPKSKVSVLIAVPPFELYITVKVGISTVKPFQLDPTAPNPVAPVFMNAFGEMPIPKKTKSSGTGALPKK